jgi:hypothetical protein
MAEEAPAPPAKKKESWFGEIFDFFLEHKIYAMIIVGVLLGIIILFSSAKNAAATSSNGTTAGDAESAAQLAAGVQESQIAAADDAADTQSNDALQANLANTSASLSAAALQEQLGVTQSNNAVSENATNDTTQLGITTVNDQTETSIDALNDYTQIQGLQTQANAILGALGIEANTAGLENEVQTDQNALQAVNTDINEPYVAGTATTASAASSEAYAHAIQQANSVLEQTL